MADSIKSNKRLKRGKVAKKILSAVAASTRAGLTLISSTAPKQGSALAPFAKWYKSQDRQRKFRTRKTFEQLRRERLIEMHNDKNGKTIITLTEAGKKKVLECRFEDLKIQPMEKWDKKWRMVIFDIPESQKRARNALRAKLREFQFHQLQKSVWVHPYKCTDEINFIIEFFNISPFVRIAEVSRFDGDKEIKEKFGL